jgi:hypothetical protein
VDNEGNEFKLLSYFCTGCLNRNCFLFQKYRIREKKEAADRIIAMEKKKKDDAKKQEHQRKIKKNMGLIRYFLCPCWRHHFDPALKHAMTEEERRAHEEAIAQAKREAELRAKNPITSTWAKMEKKMETMGQEKFKETVLEKHVKTETFRGARAGNRQQRKAARERDPELKHNFATTVNRIDV